MVSFTGTTFNDSHLLNKLNIVIFYTGMISVVKNWKVKREQTIIE